MLAQEWDGAIAVGRKPPMATDRHVAARLRRRRLMLGLTQQEMAELIGVTFQQAHKYETGMNRISAGRLYQIAEALGVSVAYFFQGLGDGQSDVLPQQERLMLDLGRNFIRMSNPTLQAALCHMAKVLAQSEQSPEPGETIAS
ncbi:MAG: helix-turn-helix transcriptional regulator [Geminicoccaceae bacterium]